MAASHRITGADGKTRQFVSLEDEHGLLEAVLRPGTYARLGDPIDTPGPFLAEGTGKADHGDYSLEVTEVRPFHEREAPYDARGSLRRR